MAYFGISEGDSYNKAKKREYLKTLGSEKGFLARRTPLTDASSVRRGRNRLNTVSPALAERYQPRRQTEYDKWAKGVQQDVSGSLENGLDKTLAKVFRRTGNAVWNSTLNRKLSFHESFRTKIDAILESEGFVDEWLDPNSPLGVAYDAAKSGVKNFSRGAKVGYNNAAGVQPKRGQMRKDFASKAGRLVGGLTYKGVDMQKNRMTRDIFGRNLVQAQNDRVARKQMNDQARRDASLAADNAKAQHIRNKGAEKAAQIARHGTGVGGWWSKNFGQKGKEDRYNRERTAVGRKMVTSMGNYYNNALQGANRNPNGLMRNQDVLATRRLMNMAGAWGQLAP